MDEIVSLFSIDLYFIQSQKKEGKDLQKKKLQLLKKKLTEKDHYGKIYELQSYKDPKNQPNKSSLKGNKVSNILFGLELKLTTENGLFQISLE